MTCQITGVSIICSGVYQRKHQSCVTGLCEGTSPVTRKMFPFDDVIMDRISAAATLFPEKDFNNICHFINRNDVKRKYMYKPLLMWYTYITICICMYFLSTVQFVHVEMAFLFAVLCVPNIVTTYSPWQGYGCVLHLLQPFTERYSETCIIAWASYQIRKIAGCACAGNAGNVFPGTAG